jgi:hypothetical protein
MLRVVIKCFKHATFVCALCCHLLLYV